MTDAHPSESVSPARRIAADVLVRVWEQDAFASAALDAELRRNPQLDPRDVGLATELVYGVLRTQPALDERIAGLASRKVYAPDARVRAHLLMGAYALTFLDRIPVFAAVSEAVTGARMAASPQVGAFANAVLRKLSRELEAGRPSLTDTVVASAPGWLRGSLRRSLGRAGATAYLTAGPVPPPTGLCLARGEDREAWIERLHKELGSASVEQGQLSPRAILVRGGGDVRRCAGLGEAWIVQEEGAQAVALAAGAKAGDRVLDACAGRGNKTWVLGQEVGPEGAVDACDLYPAKLDRLVEGPAGRYARATFAVDWSVGVGDVPDGYDVVVVDAPCSGVGTLRRRPEIGLKREPEDLARLSGLQEAIARRAATRARDGGRLLYAVCSVLKEECEEVVERLCARAEGDDVTLEPAAFEGDLSGVLAAGGHTARFLPQVHGTDGYFVGSLRVRRR